MPMDDSGNISSLDTLLSQRTERLLQIFVKNNYFQNGKSGLFHSRD